MKKLILTLLCMIVFTISCQKQEPGDGNIAKPVNEKSLNGTWADDYFKITISSQIMAVEGYTIDGKMVLTTQYESGQRKLMQIQESTGQFNSSGLTAGSYIYITYEQPDNSTLKIQFATGNYPDPSELDTYTRIN